MKEVDSLFFLKGHIWEALGKNYLQYLYDLLFCTWYFFFLLRFFSVFYKNRLTWCTMTLLVRLSITKSSNRKAIHVGILSFCDRKHKCLYIFFKYFSVSPCLAHEKKNTKLLFICFPFLFEPVKEKKNVFLFQFAFLRVFIAKRQNQNRKIFKEVFKEGNISYL